MTRAARLAALLAALGASACNRTEFPYATEACKAASSGRACEACCTTNKANSHRYSDNRCTCRLFYWFHEQ